MIGQRQRRASASARPGRVSTGLLDPLLSAPRGLVMHVGSSGPIWWRLLPMPDMPSRPRSTWTAVTPTATMTVRARTPSGCAATGEEGRRPARAIHRSAGLLGFGGAESLASPAVIPGVGWLPGLSDVRQARRRRVREPSPAAANAVAEHPRERFGEAVQPASRSAVGGGTEASDAGPSMHPRSRSGDRSRRCLCRGALASVPPWGG